MSKSMNGWIDVYVPLLKYFNNRDESVRIIGRIFRLDSVNSVEVFIE